ncbi:hypothetical protein pb186bvf_018858 [Paramecium bursaria]
MIILISCNNSANINDKKQIINMQIQDYIQIVASFIKVLIYISAVLVYKLDIVLFKRKTLTKKCEQSKLEQLQIGNGMNADCKEDTIQIKSNKLFTASIPPKQIKDQHQENNPYNKYQSYIIVYQVYCFVKSSINYNQIYFRDQIIIELKDFTLNLDGFLSLSNNNYKFLKLKEINNNKSPFNHLSLKTKRNCNQQQQDCSLCLILDYQCQLIFCYFNGQSQVNSKNYLIESYKFGLIETIFGEVQSNFVSWLYFNGTTILNLTYLIILIITLLVLFNINHLLNDSPEINGTICINFLKYQHSKHQLYYKQKLRPCQHYAHYPSTRKQPYILHKQMVPFKQQRSVQIQFPSLRNKLIIKNSLKFIFYDPLSDPLFTQNVKYHNSNSGDNRYPDRKSISSSLIVADKPTLQVSGAQKFHHTLLCEL